MITAILGKKLGETQNFTEDGRRIPITEIAAGPVTVVQIKTAPKDGYWAIQLGFDHRTAKLMPKPLAGHVKKTGQGNYLPRFLREVKFISEPDNEETPFKVGETITVDKVFQVGDLVQVTGTSKAKGFAGVVKRHKFSGGPRTHGQSDRERAPGSIGQTTTPGRVYKGKRMAGRMGGRRATTSGLTVVGIVPEKHLLKIKGLVPGGKNSLLVIQKQSRN